MARQPVCKVCTAVDRFSLIDLDLVMGDPSAWPATLWGIFSPPAGELPPSYRRFGAVEMGLAWVRDKGYDLDRAAVRRHYHYDVPKIAVTAEALIQTGLLAASNAGSLATPPPKLNPLRFLEYYDKGIAVGVRGLELLQAKIEMLEKDDKEIPLALVKMALDAGAKLAMSQAVIRAAGRSMGGDDDADEGFRYGSSEPASARMGDMRIRKIGGERRPVRDHGPADREIYTERSVQEGGVGLPHR